MIDKSFLEVCKRFNKYDVKYIVCGAYACKLHGIEEISKQERFTNDCDFIIEPAAENIRRIKEALKDIYPRVRELKEDEFKKCQTVKIVGKTEIDLISTLWNINYETSTQDTVIEKVEGVEIPVLSIDKLIESKKNSYRERDKADVYWLNKIKSTI
ncbi:MAG: hypothetical protein QMD71_03180 [bacterium]|nr:hypothetical protein [bacterium]